MPSTLSPKKQSSAAQLEDAIARYRDRNAESARMHADAVQSMPGGNTRTTLHVAPFPLTFVNANGATLHSLDGHIYRDFLSEYTAALLGHNHPDILAAVKGALDKGYNLGGSNISERQFATAVCQRFGPAMQLVRFTNSGTEANMCAIAAAIAWTRRTKVLVFEGGYHGSTIGFPRGAPKHGMLLPHDWVIGTYNDVPGTRVLVDSLPPASLAAILVEPMQGSGGAIPASPQFLRSLRELADSHGALLICDEVMTSRLAISGLAQSLGVRPDLMTLGKWVSGGMSFGAFGGRRDVMNLFNPMSDDPRKLVHAGTFNNNVLSMAGGVAALRLYDEVALNALNSLAENFRHAIETVLIQYGYQNPPAQQEAGGDGQRFMWISGRGSILAMHFAGEDADDWRALFWHHMLERDIYLAPRGFIALNIMITKEDCDSFVEAAREFLNVYDAARPRDVEVTNNGHVNGQTAG